MKILSNSALLASCFPPTVIAGITYRTFFPRAYIKQESDAFKAEINVALRTKYVTQAQLLTQVHGVRVLPCVGSTSLGGIQSTEPSQLRCEQAFYPEADGHYTLRANLCLAVLVADCAGVLLHDASTCYSAALHSGWKGTANNIVGNCIQSAQAQGLVDPARLFAWISPCARACCYEVGNEVAQHFISDYPQACAYNKRTRKYTLDLALIIEAQLVACGLNMLQVHKAPACTICSKVFHSYRRERAASGRNLVFITRHT